jgi:oligopeptide/dipeptide ABC transporter ATP-binding protein
VTAGGEPLVRCRDLVKHFPVAGSKDKVQAVNEITFDIRAGETLGLVGESDSGKTTVGKLLLGLHEPTAGEITYGGERVSGIGDKRFRAYRPRIQAVFQDPYDSLDPRKRISDVILEPLERMKLGGSTEARRARVHEVAEQVRLRPSLLDRFPHQLSGGQQQKVGVARALASSPEFIVLDEPTSALSPSARAELIAILTELQRELNVTYLFITHDLKVVETIADRIAVMYLGRIVELGSVDDVMAHRVHPYTRALLGSVLPPDPANRGAVRVLEGEIPSPIDLPVGCAFASRCVHAVDACREAVPPLDPVPPGRDGNPSQLVACIRADGTLDLAARRNGVPERA